MDHLSSWDHETWVESMDKLTSEEEVNSKFERIGENKGASEIEGLSEQKQ